MGSPASTNRPNEQMVSAFSPYTFIRLRASNRSIWFSYCLSLRSSRAYLFTSFSVGLPSTKCTPSSRNPYRTPRSLPPRAARARLLAGNRGCQRFVSDPIRCDCRHILPSQQIALLYIRGSPRGHWAGRLRRHPGQVVLDATHGCHGLTESTEGLRPAEWRLSVSSRGVGVVEQLSVDGVGESPF